MSDVFREGLASMVVFLVALPLCMGIAIASGVPPAMGLLGGIIGGLVVGVFAGSPLQVSGPAAGLTVVVFEIVRDHGLPALAVSVVLAGLLQIAAGKLRLGLMFRAVAPAVIHGMLAGIGVLIFASQFHVMVDDSPKAGAIENLVSIPAAIVKGITPLDQSPHHIAALVGLVTLVILVSWNTFKPRMPTALKPVPGPLIAVVVAAGMSQAFALPIRHVEVPSTLAELLRFPAPADFSLLLQPAILFAAIALAVIASAESLLCALAVDKLQSEVATDLDQELTAQGIGNVVAGLIGGLPVTGVIVRSSANVEAGARTRWSAVLHGIWLLLAITLFPDVLSLIPTSALAAILVYIGYKLVNPVVMRKLLDRSRAELGIYAVTVVAIVATNLLEGLLVGLMVSIARVAWEFSHLDVEVVEAEERVDVHLSGAATFMSLPSLATALQALPDSAEVHVHVDNLTHIDHACVELLADQERVREQGGGRLVVAWADVEERGQAPSSHAA